jgi:hypothetical protein
MVVADVVSLEVREGEPMVVKTEAPPVDEAWPGCRGGVNGGPTC